MNETLLLEIEQTNLPENCTVGVFVRVPVESVEAAPALRDEIMARFFPGMAVSAKIHVHRTDGPCNTIPVE